MKAGNPWRVQTYLNTVLAVSILVLFALVITLLSIDRKQAGLLQHLIGLHAPEEATVSFKLPTHCGGCGVAMPEFTNMARGERRRVERQWQQHLDFVKRTGECGRVGIPHDHEVCVKAGPVIWCEDCIPKLKAAGVQVVEHPEVQ